jgi:hypothetical protein
MTHGHFLFLHLAWGLGLSENELRGLVFDIADQSIEVV